MAEIEVNEYVRTELGIIYKYTEDEKNDLQIRDFRLCNDGKIVKHSKQLIDLVEIGDYVNGLEVEQVLTVKEFKGFKGSKKFVFTHLGGMIEDKKIRTVLTKEQFLANCYKVGGEE